MKRQGEKRCSFYKTSFDLTTDSIKADSKNKDSVLANLDNKDVKISTVPESNEMEEKSNENQRQLYKRSHVVHRD